MNNLYPKIDYLKYWNSPAIIKELYKLYNNEKLIEEDNVIYLALPITINSEHEKDKLLWMKKNIVMTKIPSIAIHNCFIGVKFNHCFKLKEKLTIEEHELIVNDENKNRTVKLYNVKINKKLINKLELIINDYSWNNKHKNNKLLNYVDILNNICLNNNVEMSDIIRYLEREKSIDLLYENDKSLINNNSILLYDLSNYKSINNY